MIAGRTMRLAAAAALLMAPLPLAAQKQGVTADFLLGRWGDNGDCNKDIVFAADGTFRSYTGGEGRWWLNGDQLTFEGSGGTFVVRVTWESPNTIIITNADGSVGRSQRC